MQVNCPHKFILVFCDVGALAFPAVNLEFEERTLWRAKGSLARQEALKGRVLLKCTVFSCLNLTPACLVRHLLLLFLVNKSG